MISKRTGVLVAFNACAASALLLAHWIALGDSNPQPQQERTGESASRSSEMERLGRWPSPDSTALEKTLLFSPSRTRIVPPPPASSTAPPPSPPRLVGIIGAIGHKRLALLENDGATYRRLVGSGDSFEGWVVGSITPGAVQLRPRSNLDGDVPASLDVTVRLRSSMSLPGIPTNE